MRTRTQYAYPPSPTSPSSPTDQLGAPRALPLSQRLRALQTELAALENELADPSNPLIQKEREEENVDPGELIRGLVDVRTRLDKIKKGKEGRARLVNVVLESDGPSKSTESIPTSKSQGSSPADPAKSETQTMVDLDHRVGDLENVVGSSSTTLDEVNCFVVLHQAMILRLVHRRRLSLLLSFR